MQGNVILVAGLAMLAAGGVFYAFVYPYLSGDIKAEKRQQALQSGTRKAAGERGTDKEARRKAIADSLKELEARDQSKKKVSLENKLMQAGLAWDKKKFIIISVAIGIAFGALVFYMSGNPMLALPGAVIGGFGIPNWMLGYLRKRRMHNFMLEFPTAIDIIVRGIKAGLPLGDCLRIIASEAREPVRGEFRMIVEAQQMGLGVGEACDRLIERVPITEANFFSIVVNIQQKAGGNLSETLGNLSKVLRDRKKMRVKVKAISMEAKASAAIIGCLPPIVALLVYLTAPTYIELLWKTQTGQMSLAGCALWMSIGILMMKKMINFDI